LTVAVNVTVDPAAALDGPDTEIVANGGGAFFFAAVASSPPASRVADATAPAVITCRRRHHGRDMWRRYRCRTDGCAATSVDERK
jgi:hypothetical protein